MIKLSVVIITLNEEHNIDRCLLSVKDIADEIVVVDSHSADNTVTIAQTYNARVILKSFNGYVEQRKFADENATYDWILAIDADEVISGELKQSIIAVKENPTLNAYRFARKNNYCGKWINHCGWYPDKKLRLYNKKAGSWEGVLVHEHWELHNKQEKTGFIAGDLLHYSFSNISDHVRQIEKFTELSAAAAADAGKSCSILKIWLGPKWTFISMYLFKLGILDGYYGYLVCSLSAYATMIKYAKTRQYAQLRKKKSL